MTEPEDFIGKKVRYFSGVDRKLTIGRGVVTSYADFPTFGIQTEDGKQVSWCAKLTEEIPEGKKCLVKECPNTEGEGRMVGPLCAPCADTLQEGDRFTPAAYRIRTSIGGCGVEGCNCTDQ